MSEVRIVAQPRTEFGKGGARRTRREGRVPAVLYGHGTDPRHVSLPARDLMFAFRGGANVLLTLEIDGGTELALPKAVQRDPIKRTYEHVDLLLVRRGEKVTVEVPVTIVGEVASDVIVDLQLTTVTVESEATTIPTGFEVSVEGLHPGAQIAASAVVLPAGTTLVGDPDQIVVQLLGAPTAEEVDAELASAEADLGSGQAGAAALAATEPGEGDIVPDTDSDAGGPGGAPTDG